MRTEYLKNPNDISIPLRFDGEQPNVYGVDPASSKPCEYGDFLGDTRRGGSVNFEQYTVIPHCSGTHTECVGHITEERISVLECLQDVFSEALLVTVQPENAIESGESYPFEMEPQDEFVSKAGLVRAISTAQTADGPLTKDDEKIAREGAPLNKKPPTTHALPPSLIIRTIPNDDSKLAAKYDKPVPPFISNNAIEYIVECGFKHMLVDLPSIDRLYDDGQLSNHRIFWNVGPGGKTVNGETRKHSTITELVYVRGEIRDGKYLLNLQIAPFETDAAPSRPVIFKIQ